MRFSSPSELSWSRVGRVLGALGLVAGLSSSACVGDIGDTGETTTDTDDPICSGEQITPVKSPLRRLTRFEYNNTVRDLLGDTTQPANAFPAEEEPLGFSNDAQALNVTPILAEKYLLIAEQVSTRAAADIAKLTGCPADMADPTVLAGCATSFIEKFGKRAYRRPLTDDERAELQSIYAAAATLYADDPDPAATAHREGIQMVIETVLQSPAFLYRVELGEGLSAVDAAGDIMPLTSYEMASRLSYFLWGSMPDDELLALAAADGLRDKTQIAEAARRMLDNDKAREAVAMFHQQWLDYDRVSNVTKDPDMFPEWSPALGELLREEMRTFVEHVVFDENGDLHELLTASYSYTDEELGAFYGKEVSGDAFQKVSFAPEEHAGILSMGALLSYYAHTNQTSPVHRGKVVREQLLCDVLAPPPADVMFELPEPDPDSTARERFSQHSGDPACSGCHSLMDPIGFGFENFDAVGRYRALENGEPVDASGKLSGTDVNGTFNGVRELAETLATSDDVKSCYSKMWFRFAYGRGETKEDECNLQQIDQAFEQSGGNVKELLVSLTQTDAFLYRLAGQQGGE